MASYCRLEPGVYQYAKHFETLHNCDLRYLGAIATKYTWCCAALANNHRLKSNFLYSDFVGFDVDNTEGEPYTLKQAIEDWSDSMCVIATTRSHQKPKAKKEGTYPIADRFRIITQWERRIETIEEFEYNVRTILKHNEPFDPVCVDAARCFYPSSKIVFANFDGIKQPVKKMPVISEEQKRAIQVHRRMTRKPIPSHVDDFLNKGIAFGSSRNLSVYITTLKLLENCMHQEKVLELLLASPFDKRDFPTQELYSAFNSA